jgi:tetratricopeptide (TPR) repeat protein
LNPFASRAARRLLLGLVALTAAVVASAEDSVSGADTEDPLLDSDRRARGFVGVTVCAECHRPEYDLWRGSHHDLAMKEAGPETVLGDFKDAEITVGGVTSRFFVRNGVYYVHTDGPDGAMADFPIRYTFGWYPLQQYLIAVPGGRLQSLGLAWDSRAKEEGGQRWFHLYPDQTLTHQDPLHWTGLDQTWNYQCADCHSTDLQKGFDPERGVYETRYAEINVACEACHGPGAGHVDWAHAAEARAGSPGEGGEPAVDPAKGLVVDLADRDGGVWQIDPETAQPVRSVPRASHVQIETCAPCHSRRGQIWDEFAPGATLDQGYRLSLLEPGLYYPDGQIRDEVYVLGSFLQSRMHHAGVVCGDCHEPHALTLRAPGNGVCARCHLAERYDSSAHHHHDAGTAGSACVDCHMPQRWYMVVDERADHSMRIPRPDLAVKLGTPDACTGCHQDKGAAWAAEAVAGWYPDSPHRGAHFGEILVSADRREAGAGQALIALAADPQAPGIVRASALSRLRDQAPPESLVTVGRLLADPDAQVRAEAVRFLELADLRTRVDLAWPLLGDPSRLVRLEAARVLAPVMRQGMGGQLRERLSDALGEYAASQTVNADRPEAHLNLALVAAAAGEPRVAEQAYRTALGLDPRFTPARANLADLYRAQDKGQEAETTLREGLALDPDSADLRHALGLAEVRAGRMDEALAELKTAFELAPEDTRYAYVYAVALEGAGRTAEAMPVLEAGLVREPGNTEILAALAQYSIALGRHEEAGAWVERLAVLAPGDPMVTQLRSALDAARAGADSNP